jgi:predicted dehydrogenase
MSTIDYSKLRVGIVGAGLMGRWHAKTAKRLGVRPVSILDKNPSQAKDLSAEIGSAEIFTDIDDMLSSTQLDIIHICTPLNSHASIAMRAIDAGVHVIVEKPVAASVAETESLLQASNKRSVKLCPVHQFGFQKGVLEVISELDSLGELLNVRFTTSSAGGEYSKNELNEIIADIIPHPLSVLQRLRPGIRLDTSQWQGVHARDGELQLVGEADGVAIDIYISMSARPTRCEMELFCSKGRITLNFFHGYAIIETGTVSRAQKMMQPFKYALKEFFVAGGNIAKRGLSRELAYPGLSRLTEEFYRAVVTDTEVPISPEEILAVAIARDNLSKRFLSDVV